MQLVIFLYGIDNQFGRCLRQGTRPNIGVCANLGELRKGYGRSVGKIGPRWWLGGGTDESNFRHLCGIELQQRGDFQQCLGLIGIEHDSKDAPFVDHQGQRMGFNDKAADIVSQ